MRSGTFLNSGAVLSLNKGVPYAVEGLSKYDQKLGDIKILNPEFSLAYLSQAWSAQTQVSDLRKVLNLNETSEQVSNLNVLWNRNFETYKSRYDSTINLIAGGDLKKAVPFMTYSAIKPKEFNQNYLPQVISHLIKSKSDSEYIYGFWHQDNGFIGCTPEVLVSKKLGESKVETMALAGTVALSSQIEMKKNSKLLDEHNIVIEDIASKLNDHKLNWFQTEEKTYGSLKHLYTKASFETDLNVNELIKRLSPTSALGVYPPSMLKKCDAILSPSERGSYGAPFGFVHKDEFLVVVCLRGLFWDKKNLYIHVGGGVTRQSIFEEEVKELELKFKNTLNKLGLTL